MNCASGKFFYFAFGSNLLKQRILINNPSAEFKTIGKLTAYKLCFNFFTGWKGGTATIVEDPDSHVWGVVWELGNEDMEHLDRQELSYEAVEVQVVSPDNRTYTCRTYQKEVDATSDNRPSPHYKDVLVRGAIQSHLPEEYIEYLKNVEDNGHSGNVELYDKVIDMLNRIIK